MSGSPLAALPALMWRETQPLEETLNEVIRAAHWLLSHT
jgi:hypothetical protein